MATRSRLGRGLGSLLSMTGTPVVAEIPAGPTPAGSTPTAPAQRDDVSAEHDVPSDGGRLTRVPLERLAVNPHQPRRDFDAAALATLADSIKANGVIQPVVVRPLAGGRFELIAGERRVRAAHLAGLTDLPAVVRDVDGYTQAQWALVENIHREDLNPMDRAEAYAALLGQLGLTQAELAGRLGENRSSVANYLRLLDLDVLLRDEVRRGTLSFGHAKVLAGVSPAGEQLRLADLCKAQGLSVRNLERVVERDQAAFHDPKSAPAATPAALHLDEVEQQIVQQLGLRVQLRGGKNAGTGRVVIHYRTLAEFDELMQRCGVTLSSE